MSRFRNRTRSAEKISAVERIRTGYRMQVGGTVVETCLHPDAVTELRTVPAYNRYVRKIQGPGKGMIRRVRIPRRVYQVRRCPDCPALVLMVGDAEVFLPPWMSMYLPGVEGESG